MALIEERRPETEAAGGAIFDGCPRTRAQAKALDESPDYPSGHSTWGWAFGLVVAASMLGIWFWHRSNTIHHRDEVERLLAVARSDCH